MLARALFYRIKPFIPRRLQISLRRLMVRSKRRRCENVWPIDKSSCKKPEGWLGWPNAKDFALVLTHDVDTAAGHARCRELMNLEDALGFRSSFNFVPERYRVSPDLRNALTEKGFEVGVHGLYHDGKLYSSEEVFRRRAARINEYLREWKAVGFRSPSMHHDLGWLHALNVEYDASTFDTDPFEPQSDGMGTIFPFWVETDDRGPGYVELPYTLPQDFTLFVLMQERTTEIWKTKLNWIAEKGGMALLNTHPDYMSFSGLDLQEEYPARYYEEILQFVLRNYEDSYWPALPKEVARFWTTRFRGVETRRSVARKELDSNGEMRRRA